MATITVPLAPYKDERGNRIEYDAPSNDAVTVTFIVTVHETAHVTKLNVDFNSNNGSFRWEEIRTNVRSPAVSELARMPLFALVTMFHQRQGIAFLGVDFGWHNEI